MRIPQTVDGYYIGYREQRDQGASTDRNGRDQPVRSETGYTFKAVEVQDINKDGKDELELTIHNLKRNTKFAVIVQAFNKKGSGPRSEEVVAQTFEFGNLIITV